jgi:HEAT repeat protein
VRKLRKLIVEEEQEIQEISIWALGEIGSREAIRILEELSEEVEDDYLAEVIDEAIDSASFSLSGAMFDFDLDEDD